VLSAVAGSTLDFRPSRDGFHFANDWPRGAPARIGPVTVFRIRGGMCGGMCVAAGRSWQDGSGIPADTAAPSGGRLADQIWHAQLASLRLPLGPLRYLWLQLPAVRPATRRRVTLGQALPALRRAIDAGRPQVLGLVRTVAWSPFAASRNHQVLAYGYEVVDDPAGRATRVDVRIYDPNRPDDDQVTLAVYADGRVEHPDGTLVAAVFATLLA
jgi:hypothetical protein